MIVKTGFGKLRIIFERIEQTNDVCDSVALSLM